MPQFKQYANDGQKTKEEALLEPISKTIQSLPALWQQHKLEQRKMELEDKKLKSEGLEYDLKMKELMGKLGTGEALGQAVPGTITPGVGGPEERALGATATPLAITSDTEDQRRSKLGSIQYGLETDRLKAQNDSSYKSEMLDLKRQMNEIIAKRDEAKANKVPTTEAQKTVDRKFGAEYASYVAGGGYADTMTQISSLSDIQSKLEKGEKLTGPIVSAQPDWMRKRTNPESMDAQQTVEQSVQRTLKQTLGGQFTEKEGTLFMQRGYDPSLKPEMNAKRLKKTITQLKMMALAKQEAIDYYEENGSLVGFKGEFYTLKDGEMVKASKDEFKKMMDTNGDTGEGGGELATEDQEALDWANSNPNDPRASQIKQRLGR